MIGLFRENTNAGNFTLNCGNNSAAGEKTLIHLNTKVNIPSLEDNWVICLMLLQRLLSDRSYTTFLQKSTLFAFSQKLKAVVHAFELYEIIFLNVVMSTLINGVSCLKSVRIIF